MYYIIIILIIIVLKQSYRFYHLFSLNFYLEKVICSSKKKEKYKKKKPLMRLFLLSKDYNKDIFRISAGGVELMLALSVEQDLTLLDSALDFKPADKNYLDCLF